MSINIINIIYLNIFNLLTTKTIRNEDDMIITYYNNHIGLMIILYSSSLFLRLKL